MGRKKVNVANIGNLSNKQFQEIKSLMADYEVTENTLEALDEYSSLLYKHRKYMFEQSELEKQVKDLIEKIHSEKEIIYNWIQIELKNKK